VTIVNEFFNVCYASEVLIFVHSSGESFQLVILDDNIIIIILVVVVVNTTIKRCQLYLDAVHFLGSMLSVFLRVFCYQLWFGCRDQYNRLPRLLISE